MDNSIHDISGLSLPCVYIPSRDSCIRLGTLAEQKGSLGFDNFCLGIARRAEILARLFAKKKAELNQTIGYVRIPLDEDGLYKISSLIFKSRSGVDMSLLLEMHRQLMQVCGQGKGERSSFRRREVIVGINSFNNYGFIAPPGDIKSEMAWLLSYIKSECGSVFSLICSFLWFFLHVHPFSDGNGRVARALILCMVGSRWPGNDLILDGTLLLLNEVECKKEDFIYYIHQSRVGDFSSFLFFMSQLMRDVGWRFESSR